MTSAGSQLGALDTSIEDEVSAALDLEITDEAYEAAVSKLLPLTPAQIRQLKSLLAETQRAAAAPAGIPIKPVLTSQTVNLSPGDTPPVVRPSTGYVTSLVFLDATGEPWPIEYLNIGNPKAYNMNWDKKGNVVLLQSLQPFVSANLAVGLKDLNTPIMVKLLPEQKVVDYRVDFRVPSLGPNAVLLTESLPGTESPLLMDVLNGIPPQGSKPLRVEGGKGDAWFLDGMIYLRTKMTLLSPGFISTLSSADGTHAYALQKAPLILASDYGKTVQLTLKGLD